MNVTLIGSFVFTNKGYGNLCGIYHNILNSTPYPETSKKKTPSKIKRIWDIFDGIYSTIWLEQRGGDNSDLEIAPQLNGTYKLKW